MARTWIRRGSNPGKPAGGRKARNILVVGALTLVSTVGGLVAANNAVSDPANGQSLAICHRTNSNTNPYVAESPDINATGLKGGHINHTGPLWDPTLKAQHIKWGDIIPPFQYTDKNNVVHSFPGLNDGAAGQQILANGCNIPNTVVPENPTVTQSVCNSDHNPTVPTIVLPTTPGIVYTTDKSAPYTPGTDVTVTATAVTPGNWFQPPAPDGWTLNPGDLTHETYVVHLTAAPNCKTAVLPENPTVTQSVCVGEPGVPTVPTIVLPTTANVTYTTDKSAPYTGGEVVTITATANSGGGFEFLTAPAGWTLVNSTTETLVVTLDNVPDCTAPASGVAPVAPTVTQAVCAGSPSQLVAPTVALATEPAGVTYTVSDPAPYAGGQSITVTATAGTNDAFSAPGTDGWTFVDAHHETFAITFNANPSCSGALAQTGVNSRQLLAIGSIVLLVGLGMQFLGMGLRRRPTS